MIQEVARPEPTTRALRVPVLEPSICRLMTLDPEQPDHFEAVADVVQKDAGFLGDLLALARSPMFSGVQVEMDPRLALVRIGAKRFVSIVLGSSLHHVFKPTTAELATLWRHSILVSCIARAFVRRHRRLGLNAEWAYALALLHDVGAMILASNDPEGYEAILATCSLDSREQLEAEKLRYGRDHCGIGGEACRSWNLPEPLVGMALHHHEEIAAPVRNELASLAVVRIALAASAFATDPAGAPVLSEENVREIEDAGGWGRRAAASHRELLEGAISDGVASARAEAAALGLARAGIRETASRQPSGARELAGGV